MPRTANAIDAARNAKERQRNHNLQKVIAAIGAQLNMEHLRKQDFLEEALRQLQEYHKTKAAERMEQSLLEAKLNFVTIQLEKAKEEITRLQRMLNSTACVTQAQQKQFAEFQTADSHQGVTQNDSTISGPSNCYYERDLFQEAPSQMVQPSSGQQMTDSLIPLPSFPCTTGEMETMKMVPLENINDFQSEVEMHLSGMDSSSNFPLPPSSNCDQATEEFSSSAGRSFEDSLTSAEVDMLKDFQEPEIDLLFGDNIDFLDLDEDPVPTSVAQLEESNRLPHSPLNPSYDINALLLDPQYF